MLVTTKELLQTAQDRGYAVGAFNVENMEMAMAIIGAAEELHAPVILQTTPSTIRYAGVDMYASIVSALAKKVCVPVALHLDHGSSYELAVQALHAGYTSLMIDGSHETFEDNIAVSRRVVEMAHPCGIPVEAELGLVGGKEDDLESAGNTGTDPDQAAEFVRRSGVDSLAVAIGTAHGFYAGTPVLDKQRLSDIRKKVDIPLVLHGASGLRDEEVRDCIRRGICKVNFATELRAVFTGGIRAGLTEKPETVDPKPLGKIGIARLTELVKNRMIVCGCDHKA